MTRKALGLTFVGEAHENLHLVTGDVDIKGLSSQVRCISNLHDLHSFNPARQGWHSYGDRTSELCVCSRFSTWMTLMLLSRISFKPGEKLDESFQFFATGPKIDHEKLSTDRSALLDFFVEMSGLPREAFGVVEWVTDYRLVIFPSF